jgi:hypothetical protein
MRVGCTSFVPTSSSGRFLLAIPIGRKNVITVNKLFAFSKSVTVWAVPYDDYDWSKEDAADTKWFFTNKTSAWQIARELLTPERVRQYEFIWWLNDDVVPRNIARFPFDAIYANLAADRFDIVQFSGFAHHMNTEVNVRDHAAFSFVPVRSVELTAPVIATRTWVSCVWPKIRKTEMSGWGIDLWVFPHCARAVAILKLPESSELIHNDMKTMPNNLQTFQNDYRMWNTTATPASAKEIRFVHIPKCAGTTVARALHQQGIVLSGNGERTDAFLSERCARTWKRHDMYSAVVLRRPLEHVYSQYLMCRYSAHGERVGFRRTALYWRLANRTKIEGFETWIDAYLEDPTLITGCFNPHNMQTRALVCSNPNVMGSHQYLPLSDASLQEAKQMLTSRNVIVGFADDIPSFVCRVLCTVGRMEQCCTSRPLDVASEGHDVPPHSIQEIPCATLEKAKSLVLYDIELFTYATHVLR